MLEAEHKSTQEEKILALNAADEKIRTALNAVYDTKEFIPYDEKIQKEFIEYNLPLEFLLN